jgi:vacuolar-type H+-ATPase subunit I/STV1
MARVRSGGGSGSAWALVVFGAGFFICLLLAIVFYTQVSGARQGEENAKSRLAEFANAAEQSSPELETLKNNEERMSIVGALLDERQWLRTTIANDPAKSRQEIEASLKSLGVQGASLLQEATRLQNELSSSNELNNTLQQELDKARARADEAEKSKSDLDQGYKDSLAKLQATLDQTTDALEATRTKIQQQKSSLDTQMAGTREEYVAQIAGLEQQMSDQDTEIRRLRKLVDELTNTDGVDPGPGNLTKADGRIVSVIGGRPEVYISLGLNDRLQMGMTFEVFDANELVKIDEYDRLRGKATLEVVSVDEGASIARIVRQERGRMVQEGDSIVNLVYDPQAVYKFYVYGEFDLDGDGVADPNGIDAIKSRVRQWGGRLSDSLTYDVDYLVLGMEPPLPTAPPDGEVDPVKIAQYVQEQREYETYQELIGEARSESLSIPILNQNRFMALTGQYDR